MICLSIRPTLGLWSSTGKPGRVGIHLIKADGELNCGFAI